MSLCFAAGKARARVPARPVAGGMTGTAQRGDNQLKNEGGVHEIQFAAKVWHDAAERATYMPHFCKLSNL